jgi:hypothetical protein
MGYTRILPKVIKQNGIPHLYSHDSETESEIASEGIRPLSNGN